MLEPMHEILREAARRTDTPLVDVRRLFEEATASGLVGNRLLLDHVHPTIAAHQRIADALADELVRQHLVRPEPGWEQRRKERFEAHLAALPDIYFTRGQERLRMIRNWTAGKATAEPPPPRPAP
jgi:hypothetical protein